MKLEDIPSSLDHVSERISLAISHETSKKLDFLKKKRGKNVSALIRMLIKDFLENNKHLFED